MACSLTFLITLCASCGGVAFATVDVTLDDISFVQRVVSRQFPFTFVPFPKPMPRPFMSPYASNRGPYASNRGSLGVSKMSVQSSPAVPSAAQIVPQASPVVPSAAQVVPAAQIVPSAAQASPVPVVQSSAPAPATKSSRSVSGAACDQALVSAREKLAEKTLALNTKQTELQELSEKVKNAFEMHKQQQPLHEEEKRKLKDSIAGIEAEIHQNELDHEVEERRLKENYGQYEKFKAQFVPEMRKELEEFKNNAEEKFQVLESFLRQAKGQQ